MTHKAALISHTLIVTIKRPPINAFDCLGWYAAEFETSTYYVDQTAGSDFFILRKKEDKVIFIIQPIRMFSQ